MLKVSSVGAPPTTRRNSIAGVKVHCSHCGGEKFAHGTAMLNTRGMTFLKLDWADRSAKVLVCANCTHITWFLKSPERT